MYDNTLTMDLKNKKNYKKACEDLSMKLSCSYTMEI